MQLDTPLKKNGVIISELLFAVCLETSELYNYSLQLLIGPIDIRIITIVIDYIILFWLIEFAYSLDSIFL